MASQRTKKVPPKAGSKKGSLSPQMETFATELAKGSSQAAAYRTAYPKSVKWRPETVHSEASRLAGNPKVSARVEELRAIAAKANEVGVAEVLAGYLAVLRADPRKLIAYHRGACRYCYGAGHKYHFTPAEFEQAKKEHAVMRFVDPNVGEFDPKGGIGFDPRKPPHQECPECHGDGEGRPIVGDTRGFGREELALYAGVKVKKDGIEVCMADRMVALAQVARHVGFFEKDNEVKVSGEIVPAELQRIYEARLASASEKSAEAAQRVRRMFGDQVADGEAAGGEGG
jgi:hypothetical protein